MRILIVLKMSSQYLSIALIIVATVNIKTSMEYSGILCHFTRKEEEESEHLYFVCSIIEVS